MQATCCHSLHEVICMSVLLCLLSTVSLVSCMATGSLSLSAFPSAQFPEPWGRCLKKASHIGLSVPLSALSDCGLFLTRNSLCKGGHAHLGTNTLTEFCGHGAQRAKNAQSCPPPMKSLRGSSDACWELAGAMKRSFSQPTLPAQNPALNSSNLPP